jgi:hypothetical protein
MIPFWEIIAAIIVTRGGFWKLIGFLFVLGWGSSIIKEFNVDGVFTTLSNHPVLLIGAVLAVAVGLGSFHRA